MKSTLPAACVVSCVWLLAGCGDYPGGRALAPATTRPVELAAVTAAAPSRRFDVSYIARVPQVPPDAKRLDLWVPIPSSDAQQAVGALHVETSLAHEMTSDPEYGNRVLHAWSDEPKMPVEVAVQYEVVRREERAVPAEREANMSRGPGPAERLLQPDRLGAIDDRIRALSARITAGKADPLSKAHAIYDYVIAHMAYDKVAPGWGNGDTLRACEVGKGNCTDFHALFISLARASGIPARFGIGFQVPHGKPQGKISGYHCWAEFWLAGRGWVPVDASEAWKDPGRRAFYFGSLDDDRFRVSLGRDVRLPGMGGGPLNYLLAPVAQGDGRPLKTEKAVTFSEIQ